LPPGELDEVFASSDPGPVAPLCENMTSSRKLEVHNIFHCLQRIRLSHGHNTQGRIMAQAGVLARLKI